MRSTQQYLSTPFAPSPGTRQSRLTQLEKRLETTINPPERYLDALTNQIMDAPCNIKPTHIAVRDDQEKLLYKEIDAPDYYIDQDSHTLYTIHPTNRDPDWKKNWAENKYTVDTTLSACIEAWLTIEEIKFYAQKLEKQRRLNPQHYLQAETSTQLLQAYGREQEAIPDVFRSAITGNQVMTLPVKLDGTHIIDFQELLDCQPKPAISEQEQMEIVERWHHYFKQCQFTLEGKIKQKTRHLAALSSATLPPAEKARIEQDCQGKYLRKMAKLKEKVTLEWFIKTFCNTSQAEYLNPLTGQPVQSIQVELELLKRIDDMLNPLHEQIRMVMKQVDAFTKKPETKAYAAILLETKFPPEKIPESLALGRIPGNHHSMEVMTHPVLIDGEYMIDFGRLQAFWESKSIFSIFWNTSWQHYNPFTRQPIKTIAYDCQLKKETDHFMKNLPVMEKMISPEKVRSAQYPFGYFSLSRVHETLPPAYSQSSPSKSKV